MLFGISMYLKLVICNYKYVLYVHVHRRNYIHNVKSLSIFSDYILHYSAEYILT